MSLFDEAFPRDFGVKEARHSGIRSMGLGSQQRDSALQKVAWWSYLAKCLCSGIVLNSLWQWIEIRTPVIVGSDAGFLAHTQQLMPSE